MTLLYDEAKRIGWLPKWVNKDEARRGFVSHYRRRIPLFERVLAGETTFETAIRPLIAENLKITDGSYRKGICNSESFDKLASSTEQDMKDILCLGILTRRENLRGEMLAILGMGIGYVAMSPFVLLMAWGMDLSVGIRFFVGAMMLVFTICFLMVASVLFASRPKHLTWRKEEAQKILEQAKFLDRVVSEWYASGKK